jgi:hypothetical protein
MIATVLGFLTALVMAVLGTQWYITQRRRPEANEPLPPPARTVDVPPLVSLEVAEQLMQAAPVALPEMESQAETWVESEDAREPLDVSPQGVEDAEVVSEPARPEESLQDETPPEAPLAPLAVEEPPDGEESATGAVFSGYCNRCRERRSIASPALSRTKSGRPSARGECPECGAGMFVFISEEEWDAQHD